MEKETLSFKYQLEKKEPRLGPGGITRGASVHDFPVSKGIAGVSMRLEPGGMRELHWHANAAEWAYVLTGNCRTTIIHPDGTLYTDTFGPGDTWYFPKGYGHSIQGIGPGECHFILIFDNGDFSEDHTFSVTDFIASMPKDIVAQNLGISLAEVDLLPKKEVYFSLGEVPDDSSFTSALRPYSELLSKHRYPLEAQQPRRIPGGGTQKLVTSVEFPISTTISGSIIELQPGALREMHWHPNADEWQYYISGTAEMSVFLAEGTAVTEQFETGDVGYVPMGAGHYIKNTGTTVCRVLIGFNSGHYQAIDLSEWLASNPAALIRGNFGISEELARKFPSETIFIKANS
ncbi:oxalate decarboxylase [Pedobacter cryoconitis]|uniref:Oxalate decarboxylase n=1 Tax=Pedobacter cryoconitis TaxID=188932 RepID=A0A7W8ZRS9_9SPHI|nr:cupin domain-containing protein [Pedobacter cryoconitis]MBB5639026.1 oxalate decarboxylase [Pedobacter cryoconitis]